MVPLIDVMLVLLVIFIITAPLLTHAVKIDLPKASSQPNLTKPENIQLGIRANGEIYWNGEVVVRATLETRFSAAARLRTAAGTAYPRRSHDRVRNVAEVMSMAARAGLTRIGFVTDPSRADP